MLAVMVAWMAPAQAAKPSAAQRNVNIIGGMSGWILEPFKLSAEMPAGTDDWGEQLLLRLQAEFATYEVRVVDVAAGEQSARFLCTGQLIALTAIADEDGNPGWELSWKYSLKRAVAEGRWELEEVLRDSSWINASGEAQLDDLAQPMLEEVAMGIVVYLLKSKPKKITAGMG